MWLDDFIDVWEGLWRSEVRGQRLYYFSLHMSFWSCIKSTNKQNRYKKTTRVSIEWVKPPHYLKSHTTLPCLTFTTLFTCLTCVPLTCPTYLPTCLVLSVPLSLHTVSDLAFTFTCPPVPASPSHHRSLHAHSHPHSRSSSQPVRHTSLPVLPAFPHSAPLSCPKWAPYSVTLCALSHYHCFSSVTVMFSQVFGCSFSSSGFRYVVGGNQLLEW